MLKRNLVANYIGQGWVAVMGLAFVPLYISYLGIEAYALIGLFAVLHAWLSLLDMGMAPTLNREMGRFTGGAQTVQLIRDLLRSVELVAALIASTIVLGMWAVSSWLASDWLRVENLSESTVAQALTIMGLVTALRFLESIYRSCLLGLQRQVLFNFVNIVMATLRALGAIIVLAWVAPTIEVFFVWQGVVSLISLAVLMASTYKCLPVAARGARFSLVALRRIGRYAGAMVGITFLSLLLTQVDKILLSRFLSLSEYGYYALATVAAGGLRILLAPIVQAWYPRLSQLHAARKTHEFIEVYHEGAQLVSVIVGSAALVLMIFAETILLLWTQDSELARASASLVVWLALGNLLNGLMTIPYHAQLAYGWTGYALRVNSISVVFLVPAIFWAVPAFGALGAAYMWVALNAGYILLGVHFMYRRILTTEKWRWYREDIVRPMAFAAVMALVLRMILPVCNAIWLQALEILLAAFVVLAAAVAGAPKVKARVLASIAPLRKSA